MKVLEGIRKEASLPPEAMLEYYDALIGEEEVNAVRIELFSSTERRLIRCFRQHGSAKLVFFGVWAKSLKLQTSYVHS